MSGSNGRNSREFSQDGVTVLQTFSEDEFGVPAVRIELESRLDDPVRVELAVTLPESESVDRVGFHPDYDPDNWSIDDNTISYRTRLSPGADATTVYAVQDLASDNGSVLLESLSIEAISAIDTGEPDDSAEAEKPGGEKADTGDSPGESEPEAEGDTETSATGPDRSGTGDEIQTPSEADPSAATEGGAETDPAPADAMRSDTQVNGDDRTAAVASGDGESFTDAEDRPGPGTESEGGDANQDGDLGAYPDTRLVDELVRRFESGDLGTETEQELRDRFDLGDSGPGDGLEQRIADLQRRVSDIEAFSTSVEAIHEQHGPPAEVLDETTAELADLAQTVDDLDERVDSLDTQGDDVESRISSVEADVESLQSRLSEIEARMDSAAAEREELASTVSDLAEWREQLVGSLTDQGGD